jgi:hypothetical protein
MTRSNYLNNSLRLSEQHKGDLHSNNPPLFANKGGLLTNKAGLLQNSETSFRNAPSAVDFMLFYTLLNACTPDSL